MDGGKHHGDNSRSSKSKTHQLESSDSEEVPGVEVEEDDDGSGSAETMTDEANEDEEVRNQNTVVFTQLNDFKTTSTEVVPEAAAGADNPDYEGDNYEDDEDDDMEQELDEDGNIIISQKRLQEAELRNATSQYLKGELSLPEYAAVLDMFNQRDNVRDFRLQCEQMANDSASRRDTEQPGTSTSMMADKEQEETPVHKIYGKEYVDNDGNILRVEETETDITDSLFTYMSKDNTDPLPLDSPNQNQVSAAGFCGFYKSGTEASSFNVRKKRKLSQTIQSMIGQSHLSYAKNDLETAIEICMEIIKEQPTCIEPFHTLSMIYETQGRMDKSLQYALVAGLLDPKRCDEWVKLAELSLLENNLPQALMCYSQAIINHPKNYEYQLKRCEIYEKANDFKSALKAYLKIIQSFPGEGRLCVEVLRKSAAIHHDAENLEHAYQSLEIAFRTYAEHITSAEINLMLELCIAQKKYIEALNILIKHCNVSFSCELELENVQMREELLATLRNPEVECVIPKVFNIDLTAKVVVILVHLEAYHLSDRLVEMIFEYDVNDFGDIYFDIAEAYMAKRNNAFAMNLLTPLVNSEKYSLAAVWLRYAESLFLLNRLEEAAEAYEKVVSLAPTHNLAKLNLSVILQRLGRSDDALETLGDERNEDPIDPELLMERCHILYDNGRIGEFILKCLHLFSRHFPRITSNADCQVLLLISNRGKRYESLKADRRLRGQLVPPDRNRDFVPKETDITSEWKLYLKLCHTLMNLERHDLLAKVTHCAMASKLFGEFAKTEREAEIHSYYSSILCSDSQELLPHYIRLFLASCAKNPIMLNLFSLAIRNGPPKRYGRHLIRLLTKHANHHQILLLRAHISFATFSYKNAINEYTKLRRKTPKNPLVTLMMASVYLHLMIQKSNPMNRSRLSLVIITLMYKYAELRGRCQESYYNLGRVFHTLGMTTQAATYYKKALDTQPAWHERKFNEHYFSASGKIIDQCYVSNDDNCSVNILDLKCEAAFNLSQIYREGGQNALANSYLMKYVVI